jgi:hypothetical protein
MWSMPRCYKKGTRLDQVQFCMEGCEEKTYVWCLKCVIQWDCYSSCVKICCQEMANGNCNRLRTVVCVTQTVKWGNSDSVIIICSTTCKWSLNPFTDPNPIYNHTHYVTIYIMVSLMTFNFCKVKWINYLHLMFSSEILSRGFFVFNQKHLSLHWLLSL